MLLKFSLIFLGFIACFTLILRGTILLMGKIVGKYVEERHRAAETIINTGKVPRSWSYKLEGKIASLERAEEEPAKIYKIQEKGKSYCLNRLDHLIDHFKTSPLVEDDKTREVLLGELQEVRNLWEGSSWQEIVAG